MPQIIVKKSEQDAGTGFGWDAADYARSSQAQKQCAQELLKKIDLSGSEKVLDIGCGEVP